MSFPKTTPVKLILWKNALRRANILLIHGLLVRVAIRGSKRTQI